MCVNHGRLDILVLQQLLDRSDVVTAFKQMGGEGMPEGVAGRTLYQTGPRHRRTHRLLYKRLIDVMPPLFAGLGGAPSVFLGKDPLPAPFLRGIGILAVECIGHRHTAPSVGQVHFMNRFDGS